MNAIPSAKLEIFKDEGYKFMGAAFEVYNDRGYGLAEEIYHECLEIELELRQIAFQSKAELKCFYKGRELKKRYIPDLFCLVAWSWSLRPLPNSHRSMRRNF